MCLEILRFSHRVSETLEVSGMEARRAQLLVKPLWGGSVCPQLHFLGVYPGTGAGSHLGEWQHTSRTGSTSPCRSRGSFGICKKGADPTRCPTRGDEPRYPALPPRAQPFLSPCQQQQVNVPRRGKQAGCCALYSHVNSAECFHTLRGSCWERTKPACQGSSN